MLCVCECFFVLYSTEMNVFLTLVVMLVCTSPSAGVDVGMAQLYLGNGSYLFNADTCGVVPWGGPQVSYGDGGPPGDNVSCFDPFDIVGSAARGTIYICESAGGRIRSVTNGIVGTFHVRPNNEINGLLMKGTDLYFARECGSGPSIWKADTVTGITVHFAGVPDPFDPRLLPTRVVYNCPAADTRFLFPRCIDSVLSVMYFTDAAPANASDVKRTGYIFRISLLTDFATILTSETSHTFFYGLAIYKGVAYATHRSDGSSWYHNILRVSLLTGTPFPFLGDPVKHGTSNIIRNITFANPCLLSVNCDRKTLFISESGPVRGYSFVNRSVTSFAGMVSFTYGGPGPLPAMKFRFGGTRSAREIRGDLYVCDDTFDRVYVVGMAPSGRSDATSCDASATATVTVRNLTVSMPNTTTVLVATRALHPSAWAIAHRFNINIMTSSAFATGSVVALAGGRGDSGSAARASTIMASLECVKGLDLVLSWTLHPTGLSIGYQYTSSYLGAAVTNAVIVVSALGVGGTVAYARHRSSGVPFPVAATAVMFPRLASSIDGYFKQAIVGCLFFVVWYDDRAVVRAVCGLMVVIYGVAGAAFLWVVCFRWVPVRAENVDGVWRDGPAHEGFVGQFGFAFSTFRAGCEWFPLVDYAVMLVFGVVSSITPTSTAHCLTNAVVYEVILLAKLCVYVRLRPRILPLVNALAIGGTLMECLGAAVSVVKHAALPCRRG